MTSGCRAQNKWTHITTVLALKRLTKSESSLADARPLPVERLPMHPPLLIHCRAMLHRDCSVFLTNRNPPRFVAIGRRERRSGSRQAGVDAIQSSSNSYGE